MQPSGRVDLLLIPVMLLVCLAVLVIGFVVLRMILSQRFRLVGVGAMAVMCMGAVLAVGVLLVFRARTGAQHQWLQVERAQMDILRNEAVHGFLEAPHLRRQTPTKLEAPLSIESAVKLELENAAAEFDSPAEFDGSVPSETGETETDAVSTEDVDPAPTTDTDSEESLPTTEDSAYPPSESTDTHTEFHPNVAAYDAPKSWLVENVEFEYEGFPAKVVSSVPAPDVITCVEDLSRNLSKECDAYVRSYSLWKINVTPELIECAIRDEHVESVGGSQNVVHKLLVFDRDFKQQANIEINRSKVTRRLGKAGIVSGVVLTSLTGLFAILSVTHRRRERRLSSQQAAGA